MARGLKGQSKNIGKLRKQGQLLEKYIVIEFDKIPQLQLSLVKIGRK